MTDSALSQQLTQWKTRLDTITSNLMDLYGAESTKVLRARVKDPVHGFSGVTQAKAARAVEMLDDLVDLYTRLEKVIDEASSLMRKGSVLRNNEERAKELLDGESVVIQTQHIVLRNRGLLDDENREVRASPSVVLTNMERSFTEARDAVAAVADAIAHVQPRLAALGQKLATLDGWAQRLGMARPATLADASQPISRVESDPVGCASELDRLDDAVAQWHIALQTRDADHKAMLTSLQHGKAALAELRDLARRSDAAFKEAREMIADPVDLVPPSGGEPVETLDAWLRSLEHNAAAGRFAAVKVGMAKWERACSDRLDLERAGYARNSAALDERTELQGRFRALCAKAAALQRRGLVLGEAVEAATRQGMSIVNEIPFDLPAGRRVVEALTAALSVAR